MGLVGLWQLALCSVVGVAPALTLDGLATGEALVGEAYLLLLLMCARSGLAVWPSSLLATIVNVRQRSIDGRAGACRLTGRWMLPVGQCMVGGRSGGRAGAYMPPMGRMVVRVAERWCVCHRWAGPGRGVYAANGPIEGGLGSRW